MTPADGFGDRVWFDAWVEAFGGRGQRVWLETGGMSHPSLFVTGTVKVFRIPLRFLRAPVNSHTPRWGLGLKRPPDPGQISGDLAASLDRGGCSGFEWALVGEGTHTRALAASLEATRDWIVDVRPAERCAVIDTTADWEPYYAARPRTLRKGVRLGEERLREKGDLAFVRADEKADWQEWLYRFLELERAGWKGHAGSAILQHPGQRAFYERASESARARGALRLLVATLDGEPLAGLLGIVENGVEYCLKTAYDERLRQYSPGHLVRREVLRRSFADPSVHSADLLGPVTEEKARWATREQWLSTIRLARARTLTGWLLKAELTVRRARAARRR